MKIPDNVLLADGFDDAFIGTVPTLPWGPELAVYDIDKCVTVLQKRGMDLEEATEYFWFNVAGAYVGEQTPVFVSANDDDDEDEDISL